MVKHPIQHSIRAAEPREVFFLSARGQSWGLVHPLHCHEPHVQALVCEPHVQSLVCEPQGVSLVCEP